MGIMSESASSDQLTELLAGASGGNVDALNRLFPLVYDELRRLAHSRLRSEREGHTLNTTALVHEAYLRLVDQSRVQWQGRAHFYAVASRVMRRILINHAEARHAAKRGGNAEHVAIEDVGVELDDAQIDELLALDQALHRLKEFNARGADVIEYRFFGGLTYEEIAEVTDTSAITVRRAWVTAKSWLQRELRETLPGWEPDRANGIGGVTL
jgi:RNA polymerase sigma factor (TIGR02999 family)